jgi:hypothetical protein
LGMDDISDSLAPPLPARAPERHARERYIASQQNCRQYIRIFLFVNFLM